MKTYKKREKQIMQQQLTDPGKKALRWGQNAVGQFYTIPEKKTYVLHLEPWHPLNVSNYAFKTLKSRLTDTGLDHVIFIDGKVRIILPHGQKMGYILGWVAWVYDTLTEAEQDV